MILHGEDLVAVGKPQFLSSLFDAGFNETKEQRIRFVGARKEFWVELRSNHEGVVFNFHDLHEVFLFVEPGDDESVFFENTSEGIIEFIAMSMSFTDLFFAIQLGSFGAWYEVTRVSSESEGSSFVGVFVLAR